MFGSGFATSTEANNMPLHGRLAFQYGIDSNKTTLKWCRKAISQVEKHESQVK